MRVSVLFVLPIAVSSMNLSDLCDSRQSKPDYCEVLKNREFFSRLMSGFKSRSVLAEANSSVENLQPLALSRAKSISETPLCQEWTAEHAALRSTEFKEVSQNGYEPYAADRYYGVHLRKCEN
ncbi:hypothetical protein MIR68_010838 [Amoeboaphelidium protococcarum]|nr:hypothetical protein MIR68_010838 [Amoeboaphelidium protococcarum]